MFSVHDNPDTVFGVGGRALRPSMIVWCRVKWNDICKGGQCEPLHLLCPPDEASYVQVEEQLGAPRASGEPKGLRAAVNRRSGDKN